jgi:ankyrin repeat protein
MSVVVSAQLLATAAGAPVPPPPPGSSEKEKTYEKESKRGGKRHVTTLEERSGKAKRPKHYHRHHHHTAAPSREELEVAKAMASMRIYGAAQPQPAAAPILPAELTNLFPAAAKDPNTKVTMDGVRYTPLLYTIRLAVPASQSAQMLATVRALISMRADVNLPNNFGVTPLMIAIDRNDPVLVKVLLDAGANATYISGPHSVVRSAMKKNNPQVLDLLRAAGTLLPAAAPATAASTSAAAAAKEEREVEPIEFGRVYTRT